MSDADPSRRSGGETGGIDGDGVPGGEGGGERVRLQKFMSEAGVASRRASEGMIEEGRVRVNGRVVTDLPVLIDPAEDAVTVDHRPVAGRERHVYVMLHKPRNTLSTLDDPDERRTVKDVVKHPSGARLYPVGRLDYDTMGLLLMTNDGALANALTHPRYGVHKTYRAVVKGAVTQDDVKTLEKGIYLAYRRDGVTVGAERTGGASLRVVRAERDRTILDITLSEGRNRQVRRMLAHLGHRVKKLTRVSMGPVQLKGLRLGEWRELTKHEVQSLRRAARRGERASGKQGGERGGKRGSEPRRERPRSGGSPGGAGGRS
ncbi:MAG: pseudouridine synthase [Planctomycetota bacterium]